MHHRAWLCPCADPSAPHRLFHEANLTKKLKYRHLLPTHQFRGTEHLDYVPLANHPLLKSWFLSQADSKGQEFAG